MVKKLSLLLFFAAILCGRSVYAAPGGTWTTIEHLAYPTPQNLIAELDGSRVTLSWDGVQWPADGFPEEIDGKTVPTNFSYSIECRYKITGTDTWCDWWDRTSRGRTDSNGDFVSRWSIKDDVESGKTYQFRIRCYSYIEPENPWDLTNPTRDGYFSEYSEVVTAYRTLDKLEISLAGDTPIVSLNGTATTDVAYTYTSTREAEGEEPLYFTFKAIEIPKLPDGVTPEAPVAGGKPYVQRNGTPLTVNSLDVDNSADYVDPTNFVMKASNTGATGKLTWHAWKDLKNYHHDNVTLWVQGWAKPETEGGNPRCVLDEAIGKINLDTRTVTATPQPDQDNILLTWPKIPNAAKYEVWRAGAKDSDPYERIESFSVQSETVMFTDMSVFPGTRYKYKIVALDADGKEIDSNAGNPVYAYSRLDVFSTADQSLYSVEPQTPWNGKVDIVVRYYSAREPRVDGTPHFKLIAENYESGEPVTVKTLTRADGEVLNPNDFTLADQQNLEQRLVWDAGKDLGETLVERLRLTVDCAGVEPYGEGESVTEWTGSPARYKENIRLDTRSPRIRKLGQGTHAYIDLDWFPGATKADLYCNGTLIHTTTDEYTRTKKLDTELNIWGVNELKLVPDKGEPWIGYIAYPAFDFTVTKGIADGIMLTWNTVDDEAVGGYKILRRKKGSTADFDALATVAVDVTTYTDQTAEEATLYEYTVVPQRTWDANIGPVPAAKEGYRSLEKIEFVQARQLYPWTTQVAIDVYYKSARQSSTDGELTYGLKAQMADGTEVPITRENLHLETIGGMTLNPNNIPFGAPSLASGATTRIWWNAPADLDTEQLPSSVLSGIVLQIVPTLNEGAPAGAAPAPATVASAGFTVDLRTVCPVTVGEKIPVVWEWQRTDTRDETKDRTVISFQLQDGREQEVMTPAQKTGEGTIELSEDISDDLWTSFRLIKREMNDDASDANVIEQTSEVLFKMPAVAPQNVQATRGMTEDEKAAVTVTWDPVPYAEYYYLTMTRVNAGGAKYQNFVNVHNTQYVDRGAPEIGLVRYDVQAVYPNQVKGESAPVVGWRTIDQAELTGVTTRWPWNGTVDIDLTYQTVRDKYGMAIDGASALPDKTVTIAVTTKDGAAFAVQSLIRETLNGSAGIIRREKVTNGTFKLGANDRIIWDAPTDAPRMREPNAVLKITLKGDEYSDPIVFEQTFDLDTRTGVIDIPFGTEGIQIPWSTRWAKPNATSLGFGKNDAWWKQTAVLTDVTDNANPEEILRTEAKLGEGTVTSWTPRKWGLNTITLRLYPVSGVNETTEYAVIFKFPDFAFRATTDNADGIMLKWNALKGAESYEIRRRKAGSSEEFTVVATVTDATTWTDNSVNTIVGDFEYVVVPQSATGGSLPVLPAVLGTRGAPQTPQNVQATQGDTTGVTVTWDAVPYATGYEVTMAGWDVAINKTVRIDTTEETRYVDKGLPRPGLGRYSVKAIYPNGYTSEASDSAIGYAVLETARILGVSTRQPWNGKVDIDVEYKTMRPRFRELFGQPDLPYPTDVTLTARTADGKTLPVRSLTRESPVAPGTYTVNRKVVQNGTALFTGSGKQRFVWDADTDTLGINAPGTTLTLTASDDYARTTDSTTVDINTTKPEFIMLTENDMVIPLPWAARWADEASMSLNMQDGSDVKIIEIKYVRVPGTSTLKLKLDTSVIEMQTQLADESGAFAWKPNGYGVILVLETDSNRATGAKSVYKSKFLRYVTKNPVTVELNYDYGGPYLDIWWTESGECTYYQVIRREVYRDGTRSNWQNMAPVSTYESHPNAGRCRYLDIGVVGGKTYEYAVLPIYYDPDTHDKITAPLTDSTVWTAGRVPIDITLDVQSAGQNSIGLSWTDVPDAYSYDILRDNGDGQFQNIGNVLYSAGTTFTDGNVVPGKRYHYKVAALDWEGNTLETSEPATGRIAVGIALSVQDIDVNSISLSWTEVPDADSYDILRDNGEGQVLKIGNIPASTETTFTDTNVESGTHYKYEIAAIDSEGNTLEKSDPMSVRVPVVIVLNVQSLDRIDINLSWTSVPDADSYDVYRDNGDGQFIQIGNISASAGTTFTDTNAESVKRYRYRISSLDAEGNILDTSAPATGYTQLDGLYIDRIEPRFPWNGLIDVLVSYKSARDAEEDGIPHFRLVAESGNNTLAVKTLTLDAVQTLDPNDFTLSSDGVVQRLIWDARTDLGANNFPDGLFLTVSCVRIEPYQEAASVKAFESEPAKAGIYPFDLRRIPEVQLGIPTTIYADLHWFTGAKQLEVSINGMSVFTTTDENNYSFTPSKEQLNIWGLNTIKLKSDNGIEQTAQIKYPYFMFTATQGNRDSIIVEWNTLDYISAYSIRRRAANTDDAFAEVALVSDTTRWADTSEETIIGEFEYIIMPLLASGEDAGPQPTSVIGYRALDLARLITIELAENGSVTPNKAMARYGETVVLTITPAIGYELDQLSVTDEGEEVNTAESEGIHTFIMPAGNVVVSATFKYTGTGIGTVEDTDIVPYKILRDGIVYIIRNGKTYTAIGEEVK